MTSQPYDPQRSNPADPAPPTRPAPAANPAPAVPPASTAQDGHGSPDLGRFESGSDGRSAANSDHARATDWDRPRTGDQYDSSDAGRSSADPAPVGDPGVGGTRFNGTGVGGTGVGGTDHDSVRAREKEAFGGMKFGSAFFGWLTTIGTTILLVAIVSAVAAGIGIDTGASSQDLRGVGIGVAIALLVILFIAYFIGGYVAARMARFNGARQGFAVWLWAVVIAIILTIAGLIAGQQTDITSQVNLPSLPVSSDELTAGGLIGLAAVLVVTLIGAILGGLTGMRFHRRVDRAGFDTSRDDTSRDDTSKDELDQRNR
ncbi:MAG: Yip1 family protein [Geodermatophilaceae bacterium]